jgi:tetratricopeptide (TPR) repeat protein
LPLLSLALPPGTDLEASLSTLRASELVYDRAGGGEAVCVFKHALTQEVALSTLLKTRLSDLHRVVAVAIERLYAGRLSDHEEALAYHYFEGEEWERACEYAKRVAYRADSLHAPSSVIDQVSRAIDAAQRCDPECCQELLDPELYRLRGRAYEAVGDFERARSDHEEAIALARIRGDTATEWRAHADLGMLWAGRDYERTAVHYERAHEIALALGDERAIAHSLNRLGNWGVNVDRLHEAVEHHEEALVIFRRLEDTRGIAETLDFLSMAASMAGDMLRAHELGVEAAAYFRQLDDRQRLAGILAAIGFYGPTYEAETVVPKNISESEMAAIAEEALRISRAVGWRANEAFSLGLHAMSSLARGRIGEAMRWSQEALSIAQQIRHDQWQVIAHTAIAAVYRTVGAADRAIPHGERALELAQAINSSHWLALTAGGLASCQLESGAAEEADLTLGAQLTPETPMLSVGQRYLWMTRAEIDIAMGRCRPAIAVLDALGNSAPHAGADGARAMPALALLRARAYLALGHDDSAEADIRAALDRAREYALPIVEFRALAALADLLLTQERADEATETASAAAAVLDRLIDACGDDELARMLARAQPAVAVRELAVNR